MEQRPDELQLAPVSPDEALSETVIETAIMNPKAMNQLAKVAKMYAGGTLVPPGYAGNPANCFIACEMAARLNVSPSFVMQNLYVVQGRPSWSGQASIALINGCGLFRNIEFIMLGQEGTPTRGCYLQAVRTRDGKTVRGTTITIQMAIDEGWMGKSGSKWKTMPEQMLKYRAASFFARVECPNVLMGFQIADEVQDTLGDVEEKQTVKL